MLATAQRMEGRFGLVGFAFGVNGVIIRFYALPRKNPHGNVGQNYWNHKNVYAFNLQVIANDQSIIYDIVNGWPGNTNDAHNWRTSQAKLYLEQLNLHYRFLLAGDSTYPISQFLMKPFSTAEAEGDPGKRLFNRCLSGLRTVMIENVFGIWKMRFPILNHIGCHISLAQDIITATAILHNLLVRWNANLPDVDLPDDLADGWRICAVAARARNTAACAAMRVPLDEAVGAAEEH